MSDGRYRTQDGRTFDTFRKRFRALIDSRGLNMKETSIGLNMSPTSISRYFMDRTPDTTALWRIADYFDVSIDWLLGRTDNRYDGPNDSRQLLIDRYESCSASDKLIIDTLLSKYDI